MDYNAERMDYLDLHMKRLKKTYEGVLIIGIGEFGGNVISKMQDWELFDFNPSYLTASSMDNSIQDDIVKLIKGSEEMFMTFIIFNMDNVTEAAMAPVIAETSKKLGMLTIGIAANTLPSEGKTYMDQAMPKIKKLQENADTIIVVPHEQDTKLDSEILVSRQADKTCVLIVESIIQMIFNQNSLNSDSRDLIEVLKSQGSAHIARVGIGRGDNEEKAIDVAKAVVSGSLSDVNLKEASYVLTNFIGIMSTLKLLDAEGYIKNLIGENTEYFATLTLNKTEIKAIAITIISISEIPSAF